MSVFIHRVRLRNYMSIAKCDVGLGSLNFLVGPNGSGKSNFLDSLRFIADSLNATLDAAMRDRGGVGEVRRRSTGHPTHFGIAIDFELPDAVGHYAFEIAARRDAGFSVKRERCEMRRHDLRDAGFDVADGVVQRFSPGPAPAAAPDRLFLAHASGAPEFRPLYEALTRMGFYNLNPDAMRELQPASPGDLLDGDGRNIAGVLKRLASETPPWKVRIEEYLARVVPGVLGVDYVSLGPRETIEFRQEVAGSHDPWRFYAANMSDGTIRALGALVAMFQNGGDPRRVPLIGFEEPEIALHPAAAGVLTDSLRDASSTTQILVTSHSTELLDDEDLDADSLLAVVSEKNETRIGPIDDIGRSLLMDRMFTAGELVRMEQLRPAPSSGRLETGLFDFGASKA
ncbi:MAG: AAA family ATPase [Planctomycetes bacterium]|nr:AAA family ATPase [Planctomycetota bacterium]